MNYIRGAVNAISAPYQYYKDINPATLTGAIDVIVIQRPSDNGGIELACSPFHVRFGKWQVLRPSEKKVTVSVNGHPIPFDMKIGEAGEAFFIFETDDDIPDDLITSPLLRPSSPNASRSQTDDDTHAEDLETDRFGAKKETDSTPFIEEPEPLDLNALPSPPEEDVQIGGKSNGNNNGNSVTPEPISTPEPQSVSTASEKRPPTRKRSSTVSETRPRTSLPSPPPSPGPQRSETLAQQELDERADAALKQSGLEVPVPEVRYQDGIALDTEGYHSAHDRERSDRTIRGHDEETNLYAFPSDSGADSEYPPRFPHSHSQPEVHNGTAYPPDSDSDTESNSDPSTPSSNGEADNAQSGLKSLETPFPTRAISEPPPDLSEANTTSSLPSSSSGPFPPSSSSSKRFAHSASKLNILTPVQEYSWEWGAFPQPSPMKTSFGMGGRLEGALGSGKLSGGLDSEEDGFDAGDLRGHGRMANTWSRASGSGSAGAGRSVDWTGKGKGKRRMMLNTVDSDDDGENATATAKGSRSRSVPPGLDESPTRARKREMMKMDVEDLDDVIAHDPEHEAESSDSASGSGIYGAGGKLGVSRSDRKVFKVLIEGKKVEFELSLVEYHGGDTVPNGDGGEDGDEELSRGRKGRGSNGSRPLANRVRVFSPDGRWLGLDEFETARLFEKGKISFDDFILDDQLVKDPRLVISWTGQQYITQRDNSPLMDALALWRESYIKRKRRATASRPVSPSALSEEELEEEAVIYDNDAERKNLTLERSKSEPPEATKEPPPGGVAKQPPTSSSWVQWWSRSRRGGNVAVSGANAGSKATRPEFKETFSAPIVAETKSLPKPVLPTDGATGSAPALPSTPVQKPTDDNMTPTSLDSSSPKKYAKTLRLTSDQLKSLNLKPGPNSITFSLSMSGAVACTARIFMWDSTDLVVISDIDGTITKSDGLGHVFAMIGRDWTHLGVAKLYTDICRNGYKVLYLTSRAIGQADATRGYLKGIKQNDYQLPEGPVIMSPDRLMASLHREVIMRKPEVFKMACLRDIQRLFGEASRNPFYAGFGNRITDALSYRSVNVPSSRIFTIDSAGEVKCELLELAGYKSSYIHMTDLVDQMFPPIHRKWAPEFTDFNFWKPPMQEFPLPDFSPPSPALSARSDNSTSTFARLRNFSLVGSRQSNIPKANTIAPSTSSQASDGEHPLRNATLQQMSSFERLSNTLGFSGRRSESPESRSYSSSSYAESDDEDEDSGWPVDANGNRRRRERRRSMTSMPGSLEDMNFGMDEEEGEGEYVHGHDEEYDGDYDPEAQRELDEAAAEEAFDEDLLAAGEMKNVPFL